MKMRSLLAMLLAVVMVMSFTSFAMAESGKTTVTIWHTFTDDQEAYLVKAAEDFNAASETVEVVVMSQPYSGFLDSVYGAVINGVGPDIIFNYASEAARYEMKYLTDLSQYIYDEEIGIANFDELLGEGQMTEVNGMEDGLIHYLPAYTTGPILYVNETLLKELGLEVPTTWEAMVEMCKVVKEKKAVAGLGMDSLTDVIQMLIMDAGATYIDVENKQVGFDTPEVRAKIAWLVENAKEGLFAIQSTGNYFSTDFNSSLCATYIGSCAGYPYIEPDGFEFGMYAMPVESWYPSWNRGPIAFYYNDDVRAEATYEFIKYFTSGEVNAGWAVACNALAPYADANDVPVYVEFLAQDSLAVDAISAVQEHLDIAGSLPSVKGASTVRNAIRDAVIKAVTSDVTVDAAWDECVALCNSALKGE